MAQQQRAGLAQYALSLISLVLLAAQLELVAPHGEKAAVLFFVRADCPISNRFAPEIERIYEEYEKRGFDIHLVYSDPGLSVNRMQAHRREYHLSAPAIVPIRSIATQPWRISARRPQARRVFVNGRLVYDGRIDNRFVSFSKTRVYPPGLSTTWRACSI